jgi:hypothetical protein
MDIQSFIPFSRYPGAKHGEIRLRESLLSSFDTLYRAVTSGRKVLSNQQDVGEDWKALFSSTVAAVAWDVLPGLPVGVVLQDDDEFGRGIFFHVGKETYARVDFKLVLMNLECSTTIFRMVVDDEHLADVVAAHATEPVSLLAAGTERNRSNLFCYTSAVDDLFTGAIQDAMAIAGSGETYPFHPFMRFPDAPPLPDAIAWWPVLSGVQAIVVPREGDPPFDFLLDNAEIISSPLWPAVLGILKSQAEIVAGLVRNRSGGFQ